MVTAHVLAMYAPVFFTGHIIARFGAERVIGARACHPGRLPGAVAMAGWSSANFFVALILLGIGWNFGFIGATTMLTAAHAPEERGRMQGMNDLIVFGGVTLASLSVGRADELLGRLGAGGLAAVNLAMLPFLMLAGGALIWLWLRPKERTDAG